MTFNPNQFGITDEVGEVMNPAANVIQAQVLPTLSTASYLSAGQVVCFGSQAYNGGMPIVRAVSTGCGVGIIVANARQGQYYANQICGLALDGTIIKVSAASTITANDVVAWGSTGVGTITTGNGIGISLDNATAALQLVRVLIRAGISGTGQIWY